MVTEIGANKRFNLKMPGIPFFLICFVFSIFLLINTQSRNKDIIPLLCAYGFSATIAATTLFFILELIYIPNGVIIDDELKQLILKYRIAKQRTILLNDIGTYKNTYIDTKAGPCYGVVIYLKKEKPVLLSNLSLNGYEPVKQFLDNARVNNAGEEKFSFVRYFIQQ